MAANNTIKTTITLGVLFLAASVARTGIGSDVRDSAPSILSHPVSRNATYGGRVSFSVSATGTPPLTYTWYHDGSALSLNPSGSLSVNGSGTLSIDPVVWGDAGFYQCRVSNPVDPTGVDSNAAELRFMPTGVGDWWEMMR